MSTHLIIQKSNIHIYHVEGNFGGGKCWWIWQTTMNLPNLPQPNFSNFKKSRVIKVLIVLVLEYTNVNFEVLQAAYLFLHGFSLWISRIAYFLFPNQFLSIEQVSLWTFIFVIPSYHGIRWKHVHFLLSSWLLTL